jgi:hypothetical protein
LIATTPCTVAYVFSSTYGSNRFTVSHLLFLLTFAIRGLRYLCCQEGLGVPPGWELLAAPRWHQTARPLDVPLCGATAKEAFPETATTTGKHRVPDIPYSCVCSPDLLQTEVAQNSAIVNPLASRSSHLPSRDLRHWAAKVLNSGNAWHCADQHKRTSLWQKEAPWH